MAKQYKLYEAPCILAGKEWISNTHYLLKREWVLQHCRMKNDTLAHIATIKDGEHITIRKGKAEESKAPQYEEIFSEAIDHQSHLIKPLRLWIGNGDEKRTLFLDLHTEARFHCLAEQYADIVLTGCELYAFDDPSRKTIVVKYRNEPVGIIAPIYLNDEGIETMIVESYLATLEKGEDA